MSRTSPLDRPARQHSGLDLATLGEALAAMLYPMPEVTRFACDLYELTADGDEGFLRPPAGRIARREDPVVGRVRVASNGEPTVAPSR